MARSATTLSKTARSFGSLLGSCLSKTLLPAGMSPWPLVSGLADVHPGEEAHVADVDIVLPTAAVWYWPGSWSRPLVANSRPWMHSVLISMIAVGTAIGPWRSAKAGDHA